LQPAGLKTRTVEAGFAASVAAGRRGRGSNSPPQFGHLPCSWRSVQVAQNVHSNEQMRASGESGGKSTSQHSQEGRRSSMSRRPVVSKRYGKPNIERFRHSPGGETTQSRPGLIGVFPVRNLTDVLLLDYVLSFPSVF
jgi:hypothetical protein